MSFSSSSFECVLHKRVLGSVLEFLIRTALIFFNFVKRERERAPEYIENDGDIWGIKHRNQNSAELRLDASHITCGLLRRACVMKLSFKINHRHTSERERGRCPPDSTQN